MSTISNDERALYIIERAIKDLQLLRDEIAGGSAKQPDRKRPVILHDPRTNKSIQIKPN